MPELSSPQTAEDLEAGTPALVLDRTCKVYESGTRALLGISLVVNRGEFFGLLGPRGSGKTTVSRILATLLPYDGGRVQICGFDLQRNAKEARRRIGYLGQYAGIGVGISGRDFIKEIARLRGVQRSTALQQADELLDALDLTAIAGRPSSKYSAAEMRRISLAGALVGYPQLLILDEPTLGMHVYERTLVWRCLQRLRRSEGTTVFMATSGLDEAEMLADRVALIDRGRFITVGSPAELKAQSAGTLVVVRLQHRSQVGDAAVLLERMTGVRAVRPQIDRVNLEVTITSTVPALLRLLEEHEIAVRDVNLSRSSLEDVFFRHTGRKMQDERETPAGSINPIGKR